MTEAVSEVPTTKRVVVPLGNYVLVLPIELPERSPGNIVIPQQAREKSGEGKVIAVGEGRLDRHDRMIPPPVKVGDIVMFTWISGRDVKTGNRTLKLLDADELLGKIVNV